jgi:hypothetical protein
MLKNGTDGFFALKRSAHSFKAYKIGGSRTFNGNLVKNLGYIPGGIIERVPTRAT